MRRSFTRPFTSAMVVLVAAGVTAACDVNLGNGDFSLGVLSGQAKDTWTRSYTVSSSGRVEVVNVNGRIEVEPGTGATVELRAERTAKASSDESAKDLLSKVQMLEDAKPDSVRVEAKPPKWTGRGGVDIKFFLKVPAGVRVAARTVNGGIQLTRIPNDVEATTVNGGVEADAVSGTLHLSSTNGGVSLSLASLGTGGVRAETVNGGVRVALPKDAKADVSAHVTNGGIGVDDLPLEITGERTRRRVEGKLNGGGPLVELETTNGGVHLTGK
jgi:Toastrack DUF4097